LPVGRDVQAEHSALAQAALDRDAERASVLLSQHYFRTVEDLAGAISFNEVKLRASH
jgi:DNA-binding GntR family transcriptional regulator